MSDSPVDVVISWVDGNDPVHADKLAAYLKEAGISRPESAAPTKFNECGELTYCVRSLLHFAPWIRTIYIVTDSQIPPIVTALAGTPAEHKVRLIDERTLFGGFEAYLPTFNCISIESLLWRIPGLSERFIYLNDDWFLIRPVAYDDFFRGDRLVLQGDWKVQSVKKWGALWKQWVSRWMKTAYTPVQIDLYREIQENSARLLGWDTHFFHLPHSPLPARKSTFVNFFTRHPEVLHHNVSHRCRDRQQYLPLSLSHHLEIKEHQAIIDRRLRAAYVNGACHSFRKIQVRLRHAERDERVAFVCMQSMDLAPESVRQMMLAWLKHKIAS